MAIITVMLVALAIFVPAALLEGCAILHRQAKEAREWRRLKKAYFGQSGKRWAA